MTRLPSPSGTRPVSGSDACLAMHPLPGFTPRLTPR